VVGGTDMNIATAPTINMPSIDQRLFKSGFLQAAVIDSEIILIR
jgi:hypothetical protein